MIDYWSLVSQGNPCFQVVFSLPSPLLPLPCALGLWMLWLDGCCQCVWSFLCLSFKAVHEHDPSLPPLYRLSYLFVYLFIFFPQNTLILSVWIKVAAYGCFPAALCCPAGLGAWCWAFTGLIQPISPAENSLFIFFIFPPVPIFCLFTKLNEFSCCRWLWVGWESTLLSTTSSAASPLPRGWIDAWN